MNILKYTREQIQQFVRDGICPVEAIRDWEIAKAKQQGHSVEHISYDHNLSRWGTYKVLNKLQGKR